MVAENTSADAPETDAPDNEEEELQILLVEDNEDDVQMFVDLISDHVSVPIGLSVAGTLADAFDALDEEPCDVILLDLSLPDSDGMETFHAMREKAPDIPIVILTGLDDEEMALNALGRGVQDYLVKGQVDGSLLMRSIRYAIERQSLLSRLKEADSKVDALTSMLPVCTSCKKVRDEGGEWHDLEEYLRDYTKARVQQTLCPVCGRRFR